ncbi:hypothetical protein SODG_002768 [Sodalis praecaptivus]|uniref:hypothetical protein n=1 Tax=Sodalis praecaptivus TaxID=1239307 RepID=UPI0027F5D902|nr:hypothetical protein [Sodalis praecaptivus]CAJ0996468.1 hypothetical protein NVIRENTERO_02410 [Sodalis praecaptivus]
MENAKTRKNSAVEFISRHLVASAYQAIMRVKQTNIAKLLGVPDSTILRRSEKLTETMNILAASGVHDFVFEGEKKLPLDEYRYLLRAAMELARIHLVGTEENAPGTEMLEA